MIPLGRFQRKWPFAQNDTGALESATGFTPVLGFRRTPGKRSKSDLGCQDLVMLRLACLTAVSCVSPFWGRCCFCAWSIFRGHCLLHFPLSRHRRDRISVCVAARASMCSVKSMASSQVRFLYRRSSWSSSRALPSCSQPRPTREPSRACRLRPNRRNRQLSLVWRAARRRDRPCSGVCTVLKQLSRAVAIAPRSAEKRRRRCCDVLGIVLLLRLGAFSFFAVGKEHQDDFEGAPKDASSTEGRCTDPCDRLTRLESNEVEILSLRPGEAGRLTPCRSSTPSIGWS